MRSRLNWKKKWMNNHAENTIEDEPNYIPYCISLYHHNILESHSVEKKIIRVKLINRV